MIPRFFHSLYQSFSRLSLIQKLLVLVQVLSGASFFRPAIRISHHVLETTRRSFEQMFGQDGSLLLIELWRDSWTIAAALVTLLVCLFLTLRHYQRIVWLPALIGSLLVVSAGSSLALLTAERTLTAFGYSSTTDPLDLLVGPILTLLAGFLLSFLLSVAANARSIRLFMKRFKAEDTARV